MTREKNEKLDSWGGMRREAMQDAFRIAGEYYRAGGSWNTAMSFLTDVRGHAAELAPKSWKGVAFQLATMLGPGAITKAATGTNLAKLAERLAKMAHVGHIGEVGVDGWHQAAHYTPALVKEIK